MKKLPEEKIIQLKKKSIIIVFSIVIVLVVLINIFFYYYLQNYISNNLGYVIVKKKWDLILKPNQNADVLILGDSSGNQGLKAELFASNLNLYALNLCTIGDLLLVDDSWMLQYYLSKHSPPKYVILIHVYDVWHRQNIQKILLSQFNFNLINSKNFCPNIKLNWFDKINIELSKYIPLIYQNQGISYILTHPKMIFKKNDKLFDEYGYMPSTLVNTDNVQRDFNEHIDFLKNNDFKISELNFQALENIIELSKKYDFKLYIANSPIYEDLYEHSYFSKYYKDLSEFLDSIDRENENVYFINNPPLIFPTEVMENVDHIIDSASVVYTLKILNEIKIIENE